MYILGSSVALDFLKTAVVTLLADLWMTVQNGQSVHHQVYK